MMKRLTYEYVRSVIEKESFTLVSTVYEHSHAKLEMNCPEGHQCLISWNAFNNGNRCTICSGKKKYTLEEVIDFVIKVGFTPHFNNYTGALDKIRIKCPEGHMVNVRWSDFRSRGTRCKECAYINRRGELSHLYKDGRYPINRAVRKSPAMKQWRKFIFKRDNYICQMCGKDYGGKQAHHILKFSTFPLHRFNLNNGITLCDDCHNKTKWNEEKYEIQFLECLDRKF